MKPLITPGIVLLATCTIKAQRALEFANIAHGINAPVTNASGQRIVGPGPFVADLFYSTNTNSVPNPLGGDSFLAAGFNQGFASAGAGYFVAGVKTLTNATDIVAQVRVWDTTYGSTFAAARDAGGQFGYSGYFVITLPPAPTPPALLSGLNGFKLTTIHSPTQGADDYGGAEPPPVVLVTEPEAPVGPNPPLLSAQYGCGPWLEVTGTNSSSVMLTLHNSAAGRPYQVWSKQSVTLTNWILETNFIGVAGQTQIRIAMGGKTNLFLRTGETNASFQGLRGDYGYPNFDRINPDSMGAVGPTHFVELLNEGIAVFAKTNGQMLQTTDSSSFFGASNYPAQKMSDPRILYDKDNQRWIASMIYSGSSNIILAVSKSGSPLDLITNWTRYSIQVALPNTETDFDTLGMDANGIYLSVVHIGATNEGFTVVAIRKQDIYTGNTNYTVLTNTNPGLLSWTIQPAVNFDYVGSNGYAWFVAKGPPTLGSGYKGGAIYYRRLQWSGSNAMWVETNWVSVLSTNYQNYYDFDGTNSVYGLVNGVLAPAGTNGIDLGLTGSKLMMAVIRNGYLWTCQHVGLSGTSGGYTGDQTGTNLDRSAAQWLNFQVGSTGLTYSASGRVFDPATTTPLWYYFPSLMVNCNGDMLMGYSGSSRTSYVGAYYSWLFSGSSLSTSPVLIQPGATNFPDVRWGDYSSTAVDPTDDWSIWTVQEYAFPTQQYTSPWATWIIQLNRDP
jgi:hypothetical protein